MTTLSPYSALLPSPSLQPAYSAYALPVASTPVGSAAAQVQTGFDPAPAPASGTGSTSDAAAQALVTSKFGPQLGADFSSAVGGGAITDALKSGVAKIAAFAQNGMNKIQEAIQGDLAAGNGTMDPAKLQQYTMQMSTYENLTKMAAKIQEKQDESVAIWLR
ncbi:MAG: hypothetical protein JWM98_1550 [Thermoleophilia bacterium]|nr:hypothetical protein [Thermoleophilia bacterium]